MRPNMYKEMIKNTELNDYQPVADRIGPTEARLLHSAIGASTEANELLDQIKKHIFYNRPLDKVNLLEELGDIMWYVNIMLDVYGWTLEEVLQVNYDKLSKRYEGGYTDDKANNRNLDTERKVLENGSQS